MARVNRVAKTAIEIDANVDRALKAVQRLSKDLNKQQETVKKSTRAFNRYNRAIRSAGRAGIGLGRSLQFLGVAAFALQLRSAVTESLALDKALTTVAKTTNLSNPGLEQLSSNLQNLSNELGIGTTKLAEITGLTGQLGVRGTQELTAFTEVIGQLGTATNLSGEAATTSLARVLKLTDSDIISNIEALGAAVAALGDSFVTTEAHIAEFMETLAPVLRLQGFRPQDIAGAATAAASVGLDPAMTRTSMYRMGARMDTLQQAPLDDPHLKMYADVMGMSPTAAQDLLRSDRPSAMLGFYSNLGGVENSRQVLEALGFTDLRTHVVAQALGTPQTTEALEYAREQFIEASRLDEETKRVLLSPAGRWQRASTRVGNLKRSVGDSMRDAILGPYEAVGEFAGEYATRSGRGRLRLDRLSDLTDADLARELLGSTKPGSLKTGEEIERLLRERELDTDYGGWGTKKNPLGGLSPNAVLSMQARKEMELAELRAEEKRAQDISAELAKGNPEATPFVFSQAGKITQLEEELAAIGRRVSIDEQLKDARSRAHGILASTPPGAVGITGISSAEKKVVAIPGEGDGDELVAPVVPRDMRNQSVLDHYKLFQEDLENQSYYSNFVDYDYLSRQGRQEQDRRRAELADEKLAVKHRREAYRRGQYISRTSPGVDDDNRLLMMTASRAPNAYEEFAAQARGDDIAEKNRIRAEDRALEEAEILAQYETLLAEEKKLFEARVKYYEDLNDGWISIADTFATSIGGMIAGVTDLRDAFGNMIRHLQQQVMEQMIVSPIANYGRSLLSPVVDGFLGTPTERAAGGGVGGRIAKAVAKGEEKGFFGTLGSIFSGDFFENNDRSMELWGHMMASNQQNKSASGGYVQTKDTPGWLEGLNVFSKIMGFGNAAAGLGGGGSIANQFTAIGSGPSARLAFGGTVRDEGLALVGEHGPEILKLPESARVEPLLNNGASGTGDMHLNINGVQDPIVVRRQVESMIPYISQRVQKDLVLSASGNTEVAHAFGR